jgi:hypothetical protein
VKGTPNPFRVGVYYLLQSLAIGHENLANFHRYAFKVRSWPALPQFCILLFCSLPGPFSAKVNAAPKCMKNFDLGAKNGFQRRSRWRDR